MQGGKVLRKASHQKELKTSTQSAFKMGQDGGGTCSMPTSSKYCHLISLAVMGFTIMLLMTPAAYHRIVEQGEATEHFHKVASTLLLISMITFPLGICGDLFVVVRHVAHSDMAAFVSAGVGLAFFYSLWFGFTLYQKRRMASP